MAKPISSGHCCALKTEEVDQLPNPQNELDLAIIGISCRFPGAANLEQFWKNLANGVESISRLSDEEMLRASVPQSFLENPSYVKAAPILEGPGLFDAAFFGFSPAEARTMDPQHRILLELAHEALENAGCNPNRYAGRIGVFSGAAMNTYFMNSGLSSRFAEDYIPTLIVNDKDFLSTRLSYKLNLKGPSITIQTACSTSLVAVHLARQSLLSHETDIVLAGAISVRVPHQAGYFCDGGGVVSPDGRVRAFDANANGTVFGSGGGIIVLKRLADALANGDTIHAVIKGSAVNNDGSEKAGYTAPSVNSQADAVVEALANAGIDAESISYVEAHGSGTPVGDPIEITALTKAFRTFTQRSGYCAIGSVKTNIGHLDAAAGIAGIIKTVLALQHRQLLPSLHYNAPNPEINFSATPFYVNTQLVPWASLSPRRAGVMSTGMGGTNAHVVLEEAPPLGAVANSDLPHLLVLSAKNAAALDEGILETMAKDPGARIESLHASRKAAASRTKPAPPVASVPLGFENNGAQLDEVQSELVELWEAAFAIQPIGVDQNFFELGGDSLLAARLFPQMEKAFRMDLPLAMLLGAPTIRQLAEIISRRNGRSFASSLVPIQSEGTKPPLFSVHGHMGEIFYCRNLARALGADQPLYGLRSQGLGGEAPHHTVEEMAVHYLKEIRTVQPKRAVFFERLLFGRHGRL